MERAEKNVFERCKKEFHKKHGGMFGRKITQLFRKV